MPALPSGIRAASPLNASDDSRLLFTGGLDAQILSRALDNMPTDFATMSAGLQIQVEYSQTGRADDTLGLSVRIVNGGTILAAASAGGTFTNVNANVTNTTDTTTSPVFNFVNTTADKAAWDGATVELQQSYVQNMGPDNALIRVDTIQLVGNYVSGAGVVTLNHFNGAATFHQPKLVAKESLSTAIAATTDLLDRLPETDRDSLMTELAPIAWWKLGDSAGTDETGNSHDLTWQNSPTFSPSPGDGPVAGMGYVTLDDASSQRASIADEIDLELRADMAFEVWVRAHDTTGTLQPFFTAAAAIPGWLWGIAWDPDNDRYHARPTINDGSVVSFPIAQPDNNEWQHIVVNIGWGGDGSRYFQVYTNGNYRIPLLEGHVAKVGEYNFVPLTGDFDVFIGFGQGIYFSGDLAEIAFWDRHLRHSEIEDLFNSAYSAADPIDLTHFDGSATFHSPTVADSSVDLDHFDGSATFHAPVVAASSIILDLHDPVNFWAPTLADSSVDLDHFDGAATFHEPTFFPIDPIDLDHLQTTQFFGPQLDGTVDLNTFDGSATFFAPSFVGVVDLNTFDGSASFFDPEFVGAIDLDTLSTTQFFAISVEGIGIITLDLFDGSATFHQITVQAGVQILDLETFDGAATFHSTFVDGNIDLDTFDGSATFHAPQIDGNIDLAHFDGAATFHEPTLDGEVLLDHFDGSATFFAVGIVGHVDLVTFDGSATFHQPAFFDITIQLDHLQTTTFFDITVTTPDVQNLDMELFDGSATFNAPQIDGNIDLDLLTSTQFFEPQVDGNIDLNLLTTTAFYEPVVGASSIDLEVFDGAASFHTTSFVGVIDLVSADLGAVFHEPTIGGASIDLDPLSTTVFRNITVVDSGAPAPSGFQLPLRGVDR